MSKLTTLTSVAVLMAFGVIGFVPGGAQAGENFQYQVLAASGVSAVALKSGDILRSGGRFRVKLTSNTEGVFSVTFHSSQGGSSGLAEGLALASGESVVLPGGNEWFSLDGNPGAETLLITFKVGDGREESAKHLIRHVSASDLEIGERRVAAVASPAGAVPSGAGPLKTEGYVSRALSGRDAPRARYAEALDKLEAGESVVMRGIKEAKLYKHVSPGVVLIISNDGIGSGSVISDAGDVLTNWHVVAGAERVGVIFKPPLGQDIEASEVYPGIVKKIDEVADLALVRVLQPPEDLTVLDLGNLEEVEVGADVHAIGHPTGESWTYTKGIISQVRANYEWVTESGLKHKALVIQTQTPINPGNSGGPLIDEAHKVIGVNSFVKSGQGLNFAVSVRDVRAFLAAPEDRKAESAVASLEECVPLEVPLDTNDDGRMDMIASDLDCDGEDDMLIVDEDFDGVPDYSLLDSTGDGEADTKILDTDGDGEPDTWLFYEDDDDMPDLIGYDYDQDGEVDRYQKI